MLYGCDTVAAQYEIVNPLLVALYYTGKAKKLQQPDNGRFILA